jgi:GNAT superfamily N-acetyltransferase
MEQYINPEYYQLDVSGKESIDLIKEALTDEGFTGYLKGSKLKYKLRAGKKNHITMDMLKTFTDMLPQENAALLRDDIVHQFKAWMLMINKEMVEVDKGKQAWFENKLEEQSMSIDNQGGLMGHFDSDLREESCSWFFASHMMRSIIRVYFFREDVSKYYLEGFHTEYSYRKKGFGKQLFESVISFCRQCQAQEVLLWCKKTSWVYEWYKKQGFVDEGVKKEDEPGCVWMTLYLVPASVTMNVNAEKAIDTHK